MRLMLGYLIVDKADMPLWIALVPEAMNWRSIMQGTYFRYVVFQSPI